MKLAKFIRLVAEIMEGTQVPRSLGMTLGNATKPWDKLRDEIRAFGYIGVDEIEDLIKKALKGGD